MAGCVPLALFDIAFRDVDSRLKVADCAQGMPGKPPEAAQVAYDEALLSPDGLGVVERKPGCADAIQDGRIAFDFHY